MPQLAFTGTPGIQAAEDYGRPKIACSPEQSETALAENIPSSSRAGSQKLSDFP